MCGRNVFGSLYTGQTRPIEHDAVRWEATSTPMSREPDDPANDRLPGLR